MLKSITHALPFALLLAAVRLLVAPTPGHAQEPKLTKQCVDFSDWEEGEAGIKFVKGNFVFTSFSREPLFICRADTPDGHVLGLRIPKRGINVSFPQLASQVVLRTVSGTSAPLEITAFNRAGDMVDQVTAPSEQGIIHTVRVNSCVSIVIKGGASEGVLVEICTEVEAGWPIEEPFIKGLDPASWGFGAFG